MRPPLTIADLSTMTLTLAFKISYGRPRYLELHFATDTGAVYYLVKGQRARPVSCFTTVQAALAYYNAQHEEEQANDER
jgi:hypothetical protein